MTVTMMAPAWLEPPVKVALGPGEIHVWRVPHARPDCSISRLCRLRTGLRLARLHRLPRSDLTAAPATTRDGDQDQGPMRSTGRSLR